MKHKKTKFRLLLFAVLQILLLINFPVANIFSLGQIQAVSAEEEVVWNCCPEMKNGAICQDIASVTPELCAVTPLPHMCDYAADCSRGCCLDPAEGLCTTNSIAQECEEGEFYGNEEGCDIAECQKGCCVLGSNVKFVTETRCELLSSQGGFEKDWSYGTELDCLVLAAGQNEGACILQGVCSRKTEAECLSNSGSFHEGFLCSHPSLSEYNCIRQSSVNCAEGKDEIYWFDSCGNRENIYSSDRDSSWNNGEILKKENSCSPDSSNINSEECGNCNRDLSSICSGTGGETHIQDGNFVCKSLKCTDENGIERENLESWCVYDSYIGDGKDPAGSRHWKRMCVEGEIIPDGCDDYRGEICTQYEIEENGKTFSTADCVVNEAVKCIDYNTEPNMQERCNENNQCMIKNINIDTYFKFDMCVPEYPKGHDFKDLVDGQICSIASTTCTMSYQKDFWGNWDCEENCNCNTAAFAQQMNDLCISLGDCGSYINYIGEGTDNAERNPPLETCVEYEEEEILENVKIIICTKWDKVIPRGEDYAEYAEPVEGKYAEPQEFNKSLDTLIGTSLTPPEPEESDFEKAIKALGDISGGIGGLISLASRIYGANIIAATGAGETVTGSLTGLFVGGEKVASTALGAFGAAAIGASLGMIIAGYLASSVGISGEAATVMALAGGTAGTLVGFYWAEVISGSTAGWGIGIAILIIGWTLITGWGKTETRTVTFTCMPWQAPTGGEHCEECNDDSLKPCSEYRCSSLGQACTLINENTENPICESISFEPNPPVISSGKILNGGHEFRNEETKKVEIRKEDGECIREWTPVLFTLQTDEYAQCKYDFESRDSYEDLRLYPLEQTIYGLNHTFVFEMPGLDSLEVYNVTGDIKELFGNLNMYVKCIDYHGNFNLDPYIVNFCISEEPDRTAPAITAYSPEDGTFLKFGTEEKKLTVYLNEPAECRYDAVEGKDFDAMANSMECITDLTRPGIYGWPCSAVLSNLAGGENKFYIKCKDKPWVQTAEDIEKYEERNTNSEDFEYSLHVTENELKIDSVAPSGNIENGFEPVSVDLEIETSGGANHGEAACYYEWTGEWVTFYETYSDRHKQEGLSLMNGEYEISVKCEDDAENLAYGNATFNLEIDSSPPVVVRAYREGSYLKLVTDEEAECYYSPDTCSFNTENATDMTTALSTTHTTGWDAETTYHIKCIDVWGHKNPGCAIRIQAGTTG